MLSLAVGCVSLICACALRVVNHNVIARCVIASLTTRAAQEWACASRCDPCVSSLLQAAKRQTVWNERFSVSVPHILLIRVSRSMLLAVRTGLTRPVRYRDHPITRSGVDLRVFVSDRL